MSETETKAKGKAAPKTMLVLDTTAIAGHPAREHQQMVDGALRTYKFEPGVPLELPLEVAIKFLKHDAFRPVDKDGQVLPYQRRPRQPDELGAGEKFALSDDETVARYSELSNEALLKRVLELPGGEKFMATDKPARAAIIEFIKASAMERRKANAGSADVGRDDFVPPAEETDDGEEAAA